MNLTVDWGDSSPTTQMAMVSPYAAVSLDHVFEAPGTYTVLVSVSNGEGGYSSASIPVSAEGAPNTAPALDFGVSPATGAAPLDVIATLAANDAETDDLSYVVDFGDGSDAMAGSVTDAVELAHTYSAPGNYLVRASVTDGQLTTTRTSRVVAASPEPVTAAAGDDRSVVVGEEVELSASASRPYALLTSYEWRLGDGSSATGERVSHTYSTPGTYIAELTVGWGDETATDTAEITVLPEPVVPGLAVTVTGGGALLAGAEAIVVQPDGSRIAASTDSSGVARLAGLADGETTLYVWAPGFQPRAAQASIIDGVGEASVDLVSGEISSSTLSVTRLEYDEIVDLGIDVTDPANQNVYEAEINLYFVPKGCQEDCEPEPTPVRLVYNSSGTTITASSSGSGSGSTAEGCSVTDPTGDCFILSGDRAFYPRIQFVEEQPMVQWLVVPVRASYLKEFFDVSLVIENLTDDFTFEQGMAGLDLPRGLSLAPTREVQALSYDIPAIQPGSSEQVTWAVRGDEQGDYDLSAAYSGLVEPIGKPILMRAVTSSPLKVVGGDALKLTIFVDKYAQQWAPYTIEAELKSTIADVPVYNAALEILGPPEEPDRLIADYFLAPEVQPIQTQAVISTDNPFTARWTIFPGIGSDNVDFMELVESMSFIQQVGGNVTIPSELVVRDNEDFTTTRQPQAVAVEVVKGVEGDVQFLDWMPPALDEGQSVRNYKVYSRQLLTSGETWMPVDYPVMNAVENHYQTVVPSTDRADGRYFTVVSEGHDGQPIYGHRVGVGAARYVSLGDSFSSGEGAPRYETGTDDSANKCHRSVGSYSRILSANLEADLQPAEFHACSGAVTADFVEPNPRNSGEDPQIDHVSEFTDVITLTVGGNDVAFADIATYCVLSELCLGPVSDWYTVIQIANFAQACASPDPVSKMKCAWNAYRLADKAVHGEFDLNRRATPVNLIDGTLRDRLTRTYVTLGTEAPSAQILIGMYPHLSTVGSLDEYCAVTPFTQPPTILPEWALAMSPVERQLTNDIVDTINNEIRIAATEARQQLRALGSGATLQVVGASTFNGYELCKGGSITEPLAFNPIPAEVIEDWKWMSASFHPNVKGQQLYADAFARELGQSISSRFVLGAETSSQTLGTVTVSEHHARLVASTSVPAVALEFTSPTGAPVDVTPTQLASGGLGYEVPSPEQGPWTITATSEPNPTTKYAQVDVVAEQELPISPIARATVTSGNLPGEFIFDAAASSPGDADLAAFEWTLPSGDVVAGPAVRATFAGEGFPVLSLRVTDTSGAVGSATISVPTDIAGPPSPPRDVSASRSGDTAEVSWSPPTTNGGAVVTGYQVVLTKDGEEEPAISIAADTLSATLSGLVADAKYTVVVRAVNAAGAGEAQEVALESSEPSAAVSGRVLDAGEPVGNATVSLFAADAPDVLASTSTGPDGEFQFNTFPAEAVRLGATATGYRDYFYLNAATLEEAEVLALSADASHSLTVDLVRATAPGAPRNVQASPGVGSASLTWQAPADNGAPITSYTVSSMPAGHHVTVTAQETSATLSELMSGVEYTFTVTATNEHGTSIPSLPSNPITPLDAETARPVVTGSIDRDPAASGWHLEQPIVTWTAVDYRGATLPPPPPTPVPDGAAVEVTSEEVCDAEGRCGQGTFGPVDVDTAAPAVETRVAPEANAQGWRNTEATVSFVCDDQTSGIDTCPQPQVIGEGGGQTVSAEVSDLAGNTTAAEQGDINVDLTPPDINGSLLPAANEFGWHNSDVTASWICTDALSGIEGTCPDDSVLSGEGVGLTAFASIGDRAGNNASGSVEASIDRTPPVTRLEGSVGGPAPLFLTLTAADNLAGVAETYWSIDDGAVSEGKTIEIDADGTHTVNFFSVDKAGNQEDPKSIQVMVDSAGPTIRYELSGAANDGGWHNQPLIVTFTCSDEGAGVSSCTEPVTVAEDGSDIKVEGQGTDTFGNTTTIDVMVNLDTTAPTATPQLQGEPNEAGWHNTPVPVSWLCTDALSGVMSCPDMVQLTEANPGPVTATATDAAGNSVTASQPALRIDTTAPTVVLQGVENGAVYRYGSVPAAVCEASDALSGLAADCQIDIIAGGLDMPGAVTMTATALDLAGNENVASVTFTIEELQLTGFDKPVTMDGAWNDVKGRGDVTMRFAVSDGAAELLDPTLVHSAWLQPIDCATREDSGPAVSLLDSLAVKAGKLQVHWTPTSNPDCLEAGVRTVDGSVLAAYFQTGQSKGKGKPGGR
ncbi:PKD domain-containing protein [Nostocoides sp. F2B08]|uniref:PKD domain-containing protein n=1 Tax=Nostocoides sp. F2B08 TaxID=2653936 RepID=UPI00186AD12A|nr:PKD domain-containing protein [Tetrasphaera sp. F2B08]